MSPELVATDRLLPVCIHGRGLTVCVCVHSQGLTVWGQCQWLNVCACAGPVADCLCARPNADCVCVHGHGLTVCVYTAMA